MENLSPEQLIDEYKKEILRVYGTEKLDKSEFYYDRGWYYINLARRAPDGKYGIWSTPNSVRKSELAKMTAELRLRDTCEEQKTK